MRSYVVKRFSHFRHSRRRRMDSPSLLSRESTTLSFSNPQNGHFIVFYTGTFNRCVNSIVTGGVHAALLTAPTQHWQNRRNCQRSPEMKKQNLGNAEEQSKRRKEKEIV